MWRAGYGTGCGGGRFEPEMEMRFGLDEGDRGLPLVRFQKNFAPG